MAIGPTGLPALPPLSGPRGTVAESGDRPVSTERFRGRSESEFDNVVAEPLDETERRQFDLEQTAEQVRQLNPNAPRGSILNIII